MTENAVSNESASESAVAAVREIIAQRDKAAAEVQRWKIELQKWDAILFDIAGAAKSNRTEKRTTPKKRVPSPYSKAALIGNAVQKMLESSPTSHVATRDLLSELLSKGVDIGKSGFELAYLSNILSKNSRFISERPYGWRLVPQAQKPD